MKQMDDFIKFYADFHLQNQNLPITSDLIYEILRYYGVSKEEQENHCANYLVEHGYNIDNIDVFRTYVVDISNYLKQNNSGYK